MRVKCIVPVSGGKDSQACLKLAVEHFGAGYVEGLFCDTQFEHDLTYAHVDKISDLYGVKIHRICAGSVEIAVRKYKRFPGGGARHCTEELKIAPSARFYRDFVAGNGPFEVWYGMREAESAERSKRYAGKVGDELYAPHEIMRKYPKGLHERGVSFRLPILHWSKSDVLEFLDGEENPLYAAGFDRVGCFPCLAAGDKHKEKAFGFDDVGQAHFVTVRELEEVTGRSVFTSKCGQLKHDSGQQDCFEGCLICAI